MATKAQLEAELATLKQQLEDRETVHETPAKADVEPDNPDEQSAFSGLLKEHGFEGHEIDALWEQFSTELGDFPEKKPLLTAVAAFGLGFVLGRMSKS